MQIIFLQEELLQTIRQLEIQIFELQIEQKWLDLSNLHKIHLLLSFNL
jgi:hypothetical protein